MEEKNGFQKGLSCVECVYTMTQLIEERAEFNIPTYITLDTANKNIMS